MTPPQKRITREKQLRTAPRAGRKNATLISVQTITFFRTPYFRGGGRLQAQKTLQDRLFMSQKAVRKKSSSRTVKTFMAMALTARGASKSAVLTGSKKRTMMALRMYLGEAGSNATT